MSVWTVLKTSHITQALQSNLLQCFGICIVAIFPLRYLAGIFFAAIHACSFCSCPLQSCWRGSYLGCCSLLCIWVSFSLFATLKNLVFWSFAYSSYFWTYVSFYMSRLTAHLSWRVVVVGWPQPATECPSSCLLSPPVQWDGGKNQKSQSEKNSDGDRV